MAATNVVTWFGTSNENDCVGMIFAVLSVFIRTCFFTVWYSLFQDELRSYQKKKNYGFWIEVCSWHASYADEHIAVIFYENIRFDNVKIK